LFRKTLRTLDASAVKAIKDGADDKPVPYHIYITIETDQNLTVCLSVDREYAHYLFAMKNVL
jgi:hypothetical protein